MFAAVRYRVFDSTTRTFKYEDKKIKVPRSSTSSAIQQFSLVEKHKPRARGLWREAESVGTITFYCSACALIIIAAIRRRIINRTPRVMHTRNPFGEGMTRGPSRRGKTRERAGEKKGTEGVERRGKSG